MDTTRDFANRRVRAAALFHRAGYAVRLTGSIDNRIGFGDVSARVLERTSLAAQGVSLWAAVFIGLLTPLEVAARKRIVVTLRLVPHRYMRLNAFFLDHPR